MGGWVCEWVNTWMVIRWFSWHYKNEGSCCVLHGFSWGVLIQRYCTLHSVSCNNALMCCSFPAGDAAWVVTLQPEISIHGRWQSLCPHRDTVSIQTESETLGADSPAKQPTSAHDAKQGAATGKGRGIFLVWRRLSYSKPISFYMVSDDDRVLAIRYNFTCSCLYKQVRRVLLVDTLRYCSSYINI